MNLGLPELIIIGTFLSALAVVVVTVTCSVVAARSRRSPADPPKAPPPC